MLQYLDKLQREDMEDLIKKRETQRALMKDVAKANEVCENLVMCKNVIMDHVHVLPTK